MAQRFGISKANPEKQPMEAETELPRRVELCAIKTLFLRPDGKKELNIPHKMRSAILSGLETSTHPEILRPVADHCYLLLRSCSHRNFVRLGVGNGTFETLCMATSMGIVLSIAGLLCILLLALAHRPTNHSRWEAIAAWPLFFIGGSLLLSGLRGSCFFFLLFLRRQPLPWERFDDVSSFKSPKKSRLNKLSNFVKRMSIFDTKLKIKDKNLRQLQRKIVIQSLAGAFVIATILVVIFIAVPIWG
jgi:hypothetical protein